MSLKDKVILFTHVQHFTGEAAVKRLVTDGARVYCTDDSFTSKAGREAWLELVPGSHPIAEQTPADIAAAVIQTAGRLDVLVNNDAGEAKRAALEEAALDDLRSALEEMVVAPFAMSQVVVGQMKQQQSGKIIFLTSASVFRGLPNYSMYVAARAAGNGLALSLSKELAKHNIQVNALAPNYLESPTYFPKELRENPDAYAKMTKNIPLGRLGKPEEMAALIAFFCDDECNFMTGAAIPIAGGWA